MENMNTEMNEVMEAVNDVVELAPIPVEEISKTNVVEAVKYLATSTVKTFEQINANENAFSIMLDGFNDVVDGQGTMIESLNTSVQGLQKQVNLMKYGLGAVIVVGLGIWIKNKFLSKRTAEDADNE